MWKLAGLYFIFYLLSIGLTFYQKWLVKELKFPITIVLAHFIIKFCLAWAYRAGYTFHTGQERVTLGWPQMLGRKGVWMVASAAALDIALSQWSFTFVDVSFYTITKSTSIVFILILSVVMGLEKKQWSLAIFVPMICAGLFMFNWNNPEFDLKGFSMLLTASFLSGIRWTVSQSIMQRAQYNLTNPFDMIYHVQPMMIIVCIPFAVWKEGLKAATSASMFRFPSLSSLLRTFSLVAGGGVIAFMMECAEFLLVSQTSSLTLSIAGIVKEILTVFLAVLLEGNELSPMNVAGAVICLVGISLHAVMKTRKVERKEGGRDAASKEALLGGELSDQGEEEVNHTTRASLGSPSSPGELPFLPSRQWTTVRDSQNERGAMAHATDALEMNILKIENCEVTEDNVDLSDPKDALDEADELLEQLDFLSCD